MIRLFLFLKKLVKAKFLWSQVKTQIDSGEIITHAAGPAVPSPPSVSSTISVIAETPVSQEISLSVPSTMPTVVPATSVIAETPVSQEIVLSVPGVPTVSVSTSVS